MLSNLFCLFLQETLNRCGIGYFTDGGTQPLNYVTVMLLSLQFQQVVRFLGMQFESSDAQAQGDMQMHGAHMGVAMLYHEVGLPLRSLCRALGHLQLHAPTWQWPCRMMRWGWPGSSGQWVALQLWQMPSAHLAVAVLCHEVRQQGWLCSMRCRANAMQHIWTQPH